jgi:hypothetical protein
MPGGDPLVVAIHEGVLNEFVVGDHCLELAICDKDIVYAVDFLLSFGA